ncbi:MAG: fumarylacetoacetate hydrolase family protein [Actinomycetota bacterium]|nr:fumarylacetoacetate hydrolase family protein [Actinomycetota bacterium]
MRLVTYRTAQGLRAGLLVDGRVFDAARIAESCGSDLAGDDWTSTRTVLQAGCDAQSSLRAATDAAVAVGVIADLTLGPPVPDPDKIICLGLNYRDHAIESGLELPATPVLFAKFRNSLIGPSEAIVLPKRGELFDYEAELAVVIGRRASNVAAAEALEHVAGVMAFNDVTARDLQHATSQWMAGKAIDTFAPCGPSLVLLAEISDIQALRIRTRVNGATVQDGNTRDMIFGVGQAIEFISSLMTLEPGDIIATGTPAGVGISREPRVLLHDGDVVEVEIDGIGVLSNPVVAERPERASA